MWSERAPLTRVDITALAHRPKARGDRLRWPIPAQPPIHSLVAVILVAMAWRPIGVVQVVYVFMKELGDPFSILSTGNTGTIECVSRVELFEIPDRPSYRARMIDTGSLDMVKQIPRHGKSFLQGEHQVTSALLGHSNALQIHYPFAHHIPRSNESIFSKVNHLPTIMGYLRNVLYDHSLRTKDNSCACHPRIQSVPVVSTSRMII